jgi:hypothetical protein
MDTRRPSASFLAGASGWEHSRKPVGMLSAEKIMRKTECYIKAVFVHPGMDRIGLNVTHGYIKAFFVQSAWTGSALM